MTRYRWAALIVCTAFLAALFVAAPEQAADVLKSIAPLWFQQGVDQ